MGHVLALDQGTTSSRAIVFDENGSKLGVSQIALPQIFPQPGWVEHDPVVLWSQQLQVAREAIEAAGITAADLDAIGVTNQRETTVVWDRATGQPVHNAIVWQDRRTSDAAEALVAEGHDPRVREITGLGIDPYYSATKIAWILDNVDGVRARAEAGELAFGTIDSWLIWNLSGGAVHVTDVTNASRTALFDIDSGDWSDELLELFGIPRALLPRVVRSSGVVADSSAEVLGAAVPIGGICGDQQAALVGNGGFEPGDTKATFGTGIFQLMYTGNRRAHSETLGVTLAAQFGEAMEYALEGSIFMGGAVVQWLVEQMHVADSPAHAQELAESVPDSNGVIVVPAFTGLGAPEWDPFARGAMFGLTRGASVAHITRAAMEAIPLQVADLADAMCEDSGFAIPILRVDGGVTVNSLVMQSLADILNVTVQVAEVAESTALGAAYLAGRSVGVWSQAADLPVLKGVAHVYEPDPARTESVKLLRHQWERAVERTKKWAEE